MCEMIELVQGGLHTQKIIGEERGVFKNSSSYNGYKRGQENQISEMLLASFKGRS